MRLWPCVACYRDAVGGCGMELLPDECSDSQVVECGCQSRAGEGRHCQPWTQTLDSSSLSPSSGPKGHLREGWRKTNLGSSLE